MLKKLEAVRRRRCDLDAENENIDVRKERCACIPLQHTEHTPAPDSVLYVAISHVLHATPSCVPLCPGSAAAALRRGCRERERRAVHPNRPPPSIEHRHITFFLFLMTLKP